MIRRPLRFAALGLTSLLLSATAEAQLGSVTYTPPAAPPPPAAPAMPSPPTVGAEAVAVPVSPTAPTSASAPLAVAAKNPEDVSGALGFGVGLKAGTDLITTLDRVGIKYWTSDSVALAPALNFSYTKQTNLDATWRVRPEMVLLFVPWKTTSTRFELGAGLGFGVGKDAPTATVLMPSTVYDLYVPIQAGVEHFFARWFSVGIAARANLFDYTKAGSTSAFSFTIDSGSYLGQLFFYTD